MDYMSVQYGIELRPKWNANEFFRLFNAHR